MGLIKGVGGPFRTYAGGRRSILGLYRGGWRAMWDISRLPGGHFRAYPQRLKAHIGPIWGLGVNFRAYPGDSGPFYALSRNIWGPLGICPGGLSSGPEAHPGPIEGLSSAHLEF